MRRRLLLVINHGVNMHKLFIVCLLSLSAACANAQSCPDPSQLKRDLVDNLVDTRTAGLLPPRVWHKMRWAPGHNKPFPSSFWLTPERAVDAIVAIEAREPRIIPAPFRAQIAAAPRDAKLRLRAAACEVKSPATRRRAAHDAAVALLLGAPADQAMPLLEAGSEAKFRRDFCNPAMPCSGAAVCEMKDNRCLTPDDRAFSFMSKDEIDVEDALTRVLLRHAATGRGGVELSTDAKNHWVYAMVHRCGSLLCQTADNGDGKLVAWDVRDGGTAEDRPPEKSAKTASREACLMHTEHYDFWGCMRDCDSAFQSGTQSLVTCQMRCEHYCRR
jgi:hypothetical protein